MKKPEGKIFSFAYHVIDMAARVFEKKNSGLVFYGENNQLPDEISDLISNSGTASECVDKIKTFIVGGGFQKDSVSNLPANPKQTMGELFEDVAESYAKYRGAYLNIQCKSDGSVSDIYLLPFKQVRRKTNGEFVKQKIWKGEKLDNETIYPEFELDQDKRKKIIAEQLAKYKKQLGFVLFFYEKKDTTDYYPSPKFLSNIQDIESDAALQVLERRNIKKSFKPNVIISTVGEIDDKNQDENGLTDYDYWADALKKFTSEDAPGLLHLYGRNLAEIPNVTAFNLADLLDGVDKARDRVGRKVCTGFGVPSILCGFQQPEGWGNTQALSNSMKLFSEQVQKDQKKITTAFQKVLGAKIDFSIKRINIATYIPDQVWEVLTPDEKRAVIDYKPLPQTGSTGESALSDRLGIGGTQNLVNIMKDPSMSRGQKIAFAVNVFGVSQDVAEQLSGDDSDDVNTNPNLNPDANK